MPRTLGSDQRGVDAFRRNDLTEVDVEAVRAHQQVARRVGADRGFVHVALHFIGQQDIDHIARGSGFGGGHWFKPVADRQIVIRTAFSLADNHVAAAVFEVLRLGMPLAAVADNGNRFVLKER